ncbi:cytochrome bc1 complex Rieske iron-sulfur subunit [Dermabacteraceae bacterium P7054]
MKQQEVTTDATVQALVPKEDGGFANPGLPPHVARHADTNPKAEKRTERMVAAMFLLSIVGTAIFTLSYFFVTPTGINIFAEPNTMSAVMYSNLFTGLGLAISVFFIGAAAVHWAKTLMPDHEKVEERHAIAGDAETRAKAVQALSEGFAETGIARRPLIVGSMLAAFAALPIALIGPLGTLGPLPGDKLFHTFWRKGLRVTQDVTGTPIKADDVTIGSIFHIMPEGLTAETPDYLEERAKAAAILVRVDPRDVQDQESLKNGFAGILAFSKICTHVGCPVALYEQQTHHLLCPCHQSTFDVTDGAKVIFGPAHRPLPQLPIEVDDEGYLVATGDFPEPVGPSFWDIHKEN